MINTVKEIIDLVIVQENLTVVIACADDDEILLAWEAHKKNIANFVLIGDEEKIKTFMTQNKIEHDSMDIINEKNHVLAAQKAISLINEGKAHLPMKGLMHTEIFLKAVLNKESGLKTDKRITQITVFDGYSGTLQFLTDCAINIKPDLQCKVSIIDNAVTLAKSFGYETPLVALLGSVETVSESMPDTIDSAVLTQMNRRGQIKGCIVDGPLSLDNAISVDAAERKGIVSPVAGKADILVASELQVSNTFSKALMYYAKIDSASVIVGTKTPIIMTSRTDMFGNKINAIAVACYFYSKL